VFTLECNYLHALLLAGGLLVLPMIDLLLDPPFQIVYRGEWQSALSGRRLRAPRR